MFVFSHVLMSQVGLLKSHSKQAGGFGARQNQKNQKSQNLKSLQNFLKEVELLRSSRDRQAEEAVLHHRRLEQELWRSEESVAALEECNQTLRREQGDMRRKVEEARQAILSSMSKVKELESKAGQVPVLLGHILQLESELRYGR